MSAMWFMVRPARVVSGALLLLVSGLSPVLANTIEYACVTEASQDAMLSFTVPGRIVDIRHREGATVAKGTALVELERRVEELEVERRKLLMEDKSELEAARNQSEIFGELFESRRQLFAATGSISREDLARMELETKSSESEYQRLLIAEQREEVEYQLALANLERRTLAAPFAGTVVEILLNEGEICEANQPLVKLVNTTRGFLVCNIEEPVGRSLSGGDALPVSIQAGEGRWSTSGKVVFVAPVVDPASGLLRVKIEFENTEGQVRPGVPGYVTVPSAGWSN